MRVYTQAARTIVDLKDIPFSANNYQWLVGSQAMFPRLPLRVSDQRPKGKCFMPIHQLKLNDFEAAKALNPNGTVFRAYTVDHRIVILCTVTFSDAGYKWLVDTQARFENLPLPIESIESTEKWGDGFVAINQLELDTYKEVLQLNPNA